MKSVRIMIVDDDQDLAESLADLLAATGYEVEIAGNGQEAVEKIRDKDFDVTLMDVRMPVMNGVDSFFAIRELKPQARVVMMTGYAEPFMDRAIAAGALGPLQKPFSMQAMLEAVDRAA
jgi:two-component system, NtrC family, response regulator HydG